MTNTYSKHGEQEVHIASVLHYDVSVDFVCGKNAGVME
jgi:hypothetical protein